MSKSSTENPPVSATKTRPRATIRTPSESSAEAARLLADADAYLRLGLVDQAIEHLAGAVHRDPSLRILRESLVKLYVTRRQYQSAIAELWALLSPCDDPREEIRFLRYIIRLGERNPVAEDRLKAILKQHNLEVPRTQDESSLQQLTLGEVEEELRAQLERHRPQTDMAQTLDIYHAATPTPGDIIAQLPGAVTRSGNGVVEALAEEIALTSTNFQDELRQIDALLDKSYYEAARTRLKTLAARYPHSKKVHGRLGVLERVVPRATTPKDAAPSADLHGAQTLPPWASQKPVRPSSELPLPLSSQTVEVTPLDIQEERTAPQKAPPPARSIPPPPPSPSKMKLDSISEAEQSLRTGIVLRGQRKFEAAIVMLDKARADAKYMVQAALNSGLCYRELGRPREAIAAFMTGVNSPKASEGDLSELFYELGATHELLGNASEAILFYQLSLGKGSAYRDANERIAALDTSPLTT